MNKQIKFIVDNYGILRRKEISVILDIPEYIVKNVAKQHKLVSNITTKKYSDECAFSKLTYESCYWAGFIAADGCISDNMLKICLGRKDISHLKKLKRFLKTEAKVLKSRTNTNTYLSVTSEKIVYDLYRNFNITSRKSLTLEPPNNLTKKQSLAYTIGYIDGDGCIGYNTKYLRLRILGTSKLLIWINKLFKKDSVPRTHCKSKIDIISFSDIVLLRKLKQFIGLNNLPVLKRKWSKIK